MKRENFNPDRSAKLLPGSLLVISLVLLQNVMSSATSDFSLFLSLICFCIAIPVLSAILFLAFLEDQVPPSLVDPPQIMLVAFVISLLLDLIGIVTAIWHISWIGALAFLAASLFVIVVCGRYFSDLRYKTRKYLEDK